MNSIRNLNLGELEKLMTEFNEKKFRANQLFNWIHNNRVDNFSEMKNIPKSLRDLLEKKYSVNNLKIEKISKSEHDGTQKILFMLHDKELIETVIMKYKYGNSLCISTQVGCRMGCKFCASTIGGLKRNLTVGEMLGQVYECNKSLKDRINHIVLMGSGEPLENYDEVIKFLHMINNEKGYNLSLRNITISTCGLVPQIIKLSKEKLPITLAISLHGATDEVRSRLMPINNKYPIKEIISAVDEYIKNTNRRVTFEYAMIKDNNDMQQQAKILSSLLKGKLVHVNLIPVNNVDGNDFFPSNEKQILIFKNILEKTGINVTIRRELGSDINAACGQLKNNYNIKKF